MDLFCTYLCKLFASVFFKPGPRFISQFIRKWKGGCKSKVNQTFDLLTSKQPQTSHLVATVKTEQLFSSSDMSEN